MPTEQEFRAWYGQRAAALGLNPNPDDPRHHYDYRAAFAAKAEPDPATGHWPSQFKAPDHPNRFVNGEDTITGRPAGKAVRELSADPEFSRLSPEARRIVVDRVSASDQQFSALSPEAQNVVRTQILGDGVESGGSFTPAAPARPGVLDRGAERQRAALEATQGLVPGLGQLAKGLMMGGATMPVSPAGMEAAQGTGRVLGAIGGAAQYPVAPLGGLAATGLERIGASSIVQEIGAALAETIPAGLVGRALQSAGEIPVAARALAETVGVPTSPAALAPGAMPRRPRAAAAAPSPPPRTAAEAAPSPARPTRHVAYFEDEFDAAAKSKEVPESEVRRFVDAYDGVAKYEVRAPEPRKIQLTRAKNLAPEERDVEERFARWIEEDIDRAVETYRKKFGNVINTDDARELSPDYSASKENRAKYAPAVHEPASSLVKEVYRRALAEPPTKGKDPIVIFSAGGTGAGKTTGLKMEPTAKYAQVIYDTNLSTFDSSKAKIDQALAAGKQVGIVYTHRDPVEAFVNGTLPRAVSKGRTVRSDIHAQTHAGSPQTVLRLADEYAGNENVQFRVVDNSNGKGNTKEADLELLRGLRYDEADVRQRLSAELEGRRPTLPEHVYQGSRESPERVYEPADEGGRPQPEPQRGEGPGEPVAELPAAPAAPPVEIPRAAPAQNPAIARLDLLAAQARERMLARRAQARATVKAEEDRVIPLAPSSARPNRGKVAGLVPAIRDKTGKVFYGRPGEVHEGLREKASIERAAIGLEKGFAERDGAPFLSREAAEDLLSARGRPVSRMPGLDAEDLSPDTRSAPFSASRATARTERGTEIETEYRLVDANDLIASNDTSLRPNPRYPQELQPRDRARAASAAQIDKIARELEPTFLGESPKVSEGAPIVGPDLVVESGNARAIALQRVYAGGGDRLAGNADKYRRWLQENAEKFGLDQRELDRLDRPVLVRVRKTDTDRAAFAREANESSVASMSSTEQALSDASRMEDDILDLLEPLELGSPGNRTFTRSFMERVVGPTEIGNLVTPEGALSQGGVRRMQNAVLAKAYGDPSILEKFIESTESNVRNMATGMLNAAPRYAKMKRGIAAGELFDLDIAEDLSGAVKKLSSLREQGTAIEEYLKQGGLFGDDLSPVSRALLRALSENSRSPKRIQDFLDMYGQLVDAAGNPNQGGLFGRSVAPAREDLIAAAARRTLEGGDYAAESLFADSRPAAGYSGAAGSRVEEVPFQAPRGEGAAREAPRGSGSRGAGGRRGKLTGKIERERAALEEQRAARKGTVLGSGLGGAQDFAEDFPHLAAIGAYRVALGADDLAKFSKAMLDEFPDLNEEQVGKLFAESRRLASAGGRAAAEIADESDEVVQPLREEPAPSPAQERPDLTVIEGGRKGGGPPRTPPPEGGFPKYAGSVNLERVRTDDDVKRAILEASKQIPKREAIKESEIVAKATDLGFDLADAETFASTTVAQRAKFLATREVHIGLQERHVAAAKAFAEDRTAENWKKANDALAASLRGFKAAQSVASEAGLALRTFAIGSRANIGDAARARINQLLTVIEGKGKLSEEITQRIHEVVVGRGLEDPAQVNDLLQYLMPKTATLKDKVFEFWVNSILSSPKTHVVNTVGTAINLVGRPLGSTVAAARDVARGAVTGRARERFFGEAAADVVGMVGGVRDAMRAFATVAKRGYSTESGNKLLELSTRGPAIEGMKGKIIRMPGTLLAAEDDAMKVFVRRGARYQMAYRQAAKEGKKGKALSERMGEIMAEPPDEIRAYEEGEALARTFQDKLGSLGSAVLNLRGSDKTGILRYFLPFVRTPANIVKAAFRPRNIAGNLVAAGLATYVLDGELTGSGPVDLEQRKALEATGWQPYSLKVGDRWFSYRRIEPFATSVGVFVDAIELAKNAPENERGKYLAKAAAAIGKNLASKTWLQGLHGLTELAYNPDSAGENIAAGTVGGFVPAAVAAVARAGDDTQREARSIGERIQKRVPGLREQLPPKRDVRGREIPEAGSPLERAISPVESTKERGDKIDRLIVDLGIEKGPVQRSIERKGKRITLGGHDYDRLKELTGVEVDKKLKRMTVSGLSRERQREKIEDRIEEGRRRGRALFMREYVRRPSPR